MNNTVAVILLASGIGKRTQLNTPKQYYKITNITLLEECLNTFLNHNINYILPVINQQYLDIVTPILSKYKNNKILLPLCQGGSERKDSVLKGLQALQALNPTKVLIHDVSRPFVNQQIINQVITAIAPARGAVPALKINDTLKTVEDGLIQNSIDRNKIYAIQTPQGFIFQEILQAYTNHINELYTDDSSYFLQDKTHSVKIVSGNLQNSKITFPQDFDILEKISFKKEIRVGQGIDIHEFNQLKTTKEITIANSNNNTCVYLGGIAIPYEQSLKGHSDADVVLHAIVDALLGTISAGDIGDLFPPSDKQWLNARSDIFLNSAKQLIKNHGGTIMNIDVTIVAEEPYISTYKATMKQNIATILEIDADRVSIKATTAEKLGFIGRKEGIYASCIATIEFLKKII